MSKYKYRKARGFSLQEILITLVIIAILSGMAFFALGAYTDRTRATRITADLEALRSAVLSYSQEVGSWNRNAFDSAEGQDAGMISIASISPYLDRSIDRFRITRSNDRLLVGFENPPRFESSIRNKLAQTATADGLLDENGDTYSGGTSIYIYVR